jgi:radical SAM protein with 4Fe4S-binding SPASM domain
MGGGHYLELVAAAQRDFVPLSVLAEITWRCPSRCVHCHFWPRGDESRELPTAGWIRIFDQLAAAGTLFMALSGGEPLARSDIFKLLDEAVRRGFFVTVLTSAHPLDDEGARRLAGAGPAMVQVSLYGADPVVYEAVTGLPGSFGRLRRNLELLQRLGVPLSLKAPVLRSTWRSLPACFEFAAALGVPFKPDFTLFPDCQSPGGHPEMLDEIELAEALRLCRPYLPPPAPGATGPDDPLCAAGARFAAIAPDGRVYACPYHKECAGDLGERSFGEIWRDSPVLASFRRLTRRVWARCADCLDEPHCRRCPALSSLTGGSFTEISDTLCRLNRVQARLLAEDSPQRHKEHKGNLNAGL